MQQPNVIAIDGPAGSGKSTVAKEVARRLGFLYIDTGAMYRTLTLKAINKGLDFSDKEALVELSKGIDIKLKESSVELDSEDVSRKIRSMEVTTAVKLLASIKGVRENMVKLQRKLGCLSSGAVLEGRDIGTVVFPDAAHKFYLDAGFRTRVARRFKELKEKGFSISREEIKEDVRQRDASDMTREIGPLKKAKAAAVIDTTDMKIVQVIDKILEIVKSGK